MRSDVSWQDMSVWPGKASSVKPSAHKTFLGSPILSFTVISLQGEEQSDLCWYTDIVIWDSCWPDWPAGRPRAASTSQAVIRAAAGPFLNLIARLCLCLLKLQTAVCSGWFIVGPIYLPWIPAIILLCTLFIARWAIIVDFSCIFLILFTGRMRCVFEMAFRWADFNSKINQSINTGTCWIKFDRGGFFLANLKLLSEIFLLPHIWIITTHDCQVWLPLSERFTGSGSLGSLEFDAWPILMCTAIDQKGI